MVNPSNGMTFISLINSTNRITYSYKWFVRKYTRFTYYWALYLMLTLPIGIDQFAEQEIVAYINK